MYNTYVVEFMEKLKKSVKTNKISLKKEIKERTVGYILAAFSFVAGLAWNEAVKSLIDFFPNTINNVLIKFLYAIVVTAIIVVITVYLARLIEEKDKK